MQIPMPAEVVAVVEVYTSAMGFCAECSGVDPGNR